jgi:subtilisin family serine protease
MNKKLKPVSILLSLLLTGLLFLPHTNFITTPQPLPSPPDVTIPHKPTTKTPEPVTNLKPQTLAASPVSSTGTNRSFDGTAIVSFTSQSALSNFLTSNQLQFNQLIPLPNLGAYVAPLNPGQLIATTDANIYPNLEYQATLTTNDPLNAQTYHLNKVVAPAAWDITTGSSATTVAVIDTGFALSHQDLVGRWQLNPAEMGPTDQEGPAPNCSSQGLALDKSCNNLDNDGDGFPSNWRGWNFADGNNNVQAGSQDPAGTSAFHGSLVAGIIGANSNNGQGVAGLDWNAKILPLRALDDNGSGYTSDVASAVRYAADHGAKVINLSLGGSSSDAFLRQQIDYAISKGIIIVAAAGNSGCNCLSYPANYPEVIAVGATNQSDGLATFSSYGTNLDLVAPGVNICSTSWTQTNPTNLYSCSFSGTSFASPIVAGIVSLMTARLPQATSDDVMRALSKTTTKLAAMGGAEKTLQYGYGLAQANRGVIQVSLISPEGQLLNKSSISLSSANPLTSDGLTSTCLSIPGASCTIILSKAGQDRSLGTKTIDPLGSAEFDWSAASLALAPGIWQVTATVNYNGQTASQTETLTISP